MPEHTEPQFTPLGGQILVFRPDRNTQDRDYTGAFKPESDRFAALYGVPPAHLIEVDVSQAHPDRKGPVLDAICGRDPIRALVFFCHGWASGLQLGFRTETAPVLAAALKGRATPDLAIVLYACSTADGVDPDGDGPAPGGEGGFADRLRDTLVAIGLTGAHVDAHDRLGHTVRNPYVRRFSGQTVLGGDWIVPPDLEVERAWARLRKQLGSGDKITPAILKAEMGGTFGAGETWARWRFALRDTDLRFRFPFLSVQQIRAELAAAGPLPA